MAAVLGSLRGVVLTSSLVFAPLACSTSRQSAPPPTYYPAPYPAYAGAPGYGAPPAGAPQTGAPVVGAPAAPVAYDPINAVDIGYLRNQAQTTMAELVNALPALQQSRVRGIPLVVDDEVGEVNAFAACTQGGRSVMAVSDGLLDVAAHLAQARALDETFGSRKVDEYVAFVARNQRPKSPVVRPPPGFFDPAQSMDGRKVQRQHQVLEEALAFILGHELAHHYLGHLPCTAGNVTASEIGRVLTDVVPALNQQFELAADMAGINNVLTTGARRAGYHYTEGGALLTMQFFGGMDQLSPVDILFGFELTHPPAGIRIPVIQQTANAFRATGGQGLPIFGF